MKDGKISKMQTKPDQVDPASPGQKGFSEPVETLFFSKHFFKKKKRTEIGWLRRPKVGCNSCENKFPRQILFFRFIFSVALGFCVFRL